MNTLQILQDAGALPTEDSRRKTRSIMQRAAEDHTKKITPYGPVVRLIDAPHGKWKLCEPRAYMRYLSTLHEAYGTTMKACTSEHRLTIVLYLDELIPGNPFRQDKARKLVAFYWACLEWYPWLLSRSAMWPCLGVLASKQLDRIPGGLSQFYAFLLEHIFSQGSFDVHIVVGKERLRLCVVYGGLMADEKALKEVHDYKGASGLKACMDCGNMIRGRLEPIYSACYDQ